MSTATATKYHPYSIMLQGKGEGTTFWVLNPKGNKVSEWLTIDGAKAAAELLAGGYFKE